MSASPTMIVHKTKPVFQRNALIPALELFVDLEPYVKWSSTQPFATVPQVYKEMKGLLVLRLNAQQMLTVQTMKNVTIQKEAKEKSAYLSVLSPDVFLEPYAQQIITWKSVPAGHLWKEMVMLPVLNVRYILLIVENIIFILQFYLSCNITSSYFSISCSCWRTRMSRRSRLSFQACMHIPVMSESLHS